MKTNTFQMISNGSMTGTSTIDSNPVALEQVFGYAIQAVWTGTPNGTLKLQASSDAPNPQTQQSNGGPDAVANWSDVTGSSVSVTGSAGNFMWNVSDVMYRYVRLVYTNSSSTGTLSAEICVKGT